MAVQVIQTWVFGQAPRLSRDHESRPHVPRGLMWRLGGITCEQQPQERGTATPFPVPDLTPGSSRGKRQGWHLVQLVSDREPDGPICSAHPPSPRLPARLTSWFFCFWGLKSLQHDSGLTQNPCPRDQLPQSETRASESQRNHHTEPGEDQRDPSQGRRRPWGTPPCPSVLPRHTQALPFLPLNQGNHG